MSAPTTHRVLIRPYTRRGPRDRGSSFSWLVGRSEAPYVLPARLDAPDPTTPHVPAAAAAAALPGRAGGRHSGGRRARWVPHSPATPLFPPPPQPGRGELPLWGVAGRGRGARGWLPSLVLGGGAILPAEVTPESSPPRLCRLLAHSLGYQANKTSATANINMGGGTSQLAP